jgi:hypothetical protein
MKRGKGGGTHHRAWSAAVIWRKIDDGGGVPVTGAGQMDSPMWSHTGNRMGWLGGFFVPEQRRNGEESRGLGAVRSGDQRGGGPGDEWSWGSRCGRWPAMDGVSGVLQGGSDKGKMTWRVGRPEEEENGPSPRAQCQFPFIPKFSSTSKLKWSKEGLLDLKKFQIKYEFVGN